MPETNPRYFAFREQSMKYLQRVFDKYKGIALYISSVRRFRKRIINAHYVVNAVVIVTVIAIVFFDAVMDVTVLTIVDISNPLMTIVAYWGEESSLSADVTSTRNPDWPELSNYIRGQVEVDVCLLSFSCPLLWVSALIWGENRLSLTNRSASLLHQPISSLCVWKYVSQYWSH